MGKRRLLKIIHEDEEHSRCSIHNPSLSFCLEDTNMIESETPACYHMKWIELTLMQIINKQSIIRVSSSVLRPSPARRSGPHPDPWSLRLGTIWDGSLIGVAPKGSMYTKPTDSLGWYFFQEGKFPWHGQCFSSGCPFAPNTPVLIFWLSIPLWESLWLLSRLFM